MITGKLNIVTDAMHGSTGKGLITSYLADKARPQVLSTTNMANAGHTAVNEDGVPFVAKALPSATALVKWRQGYKPAVFVGASAAFHLEQIEKEMVETETTDLVCVHPRAGVITDSHRQREAGSDKDSTKHIASTMQGCGTFLSDKVLRKKDLLLARDYDKLEQMVKRSVVRTALAGTDHSYRYHMPLPADGTCNKARELMEVLSSGATILHEGSQGFSLDINHGSHYPQCTSRSTTAVQNLADLGLPVSVVGDIYLVMRPYPIRVGNVVEDGVTTGHSGGCYNDNVETTWEQVAKDCGAPQEEMAKELTTVTKRLRRVFTFSPQQLEEAVLCNGATKIALNFANYIDWSCYATNDPEKLSQKVMDFIHKIEDIARIPVALVGTGPRLNHVCKL
jgi:adenylosuccinate synthase